MKAVVEVIIDEINAIFSSTFDKRDTIGKENINAFFFIISIYLVEKYFLV